MGNWYGVTLSKETASVFKDFLRQEPAIITFEPSECYQNIHIEFKTELSFEEIINKYIAYGTAKEDSV